MLDYNKDDVIDNNIKTIPIPTFIHNELKHFSKEDTGRSLPSLLDGLKPSTRKILYACTLRKLFSKKDEIRVAQLAGYVSDKTCYHHGEASLNDAIVGMAQNFVGTNNINLLFPSGQFGTRLLGGNDNASPRYIHTYLEKLTKFIFRQDDEPILKHLDDDGVKIEPENYYPIIPMILVNGSKGIGTGFSTSIPCYNPTDIIDNLLNLIDNKEVNVMNPWYKNFMGNIVKIDSDTYDIYGNYNIIDDNTILLNELPIGIWTSSYKDFLETIQYDADTSKNVIVGFTDNNTDERISFAITFPDRKLTLYQNNDTIESRLRLVKKLKTSNMHVFDENGNIKLFKNAEDILTHWYGIRLEKYQERINFLIGKISNELDLLKYKALFIKYVLEDKIIVFKQKKQDIINKLEEFNFPQLSTNNDVKSYDYITTMPLFNLTYEKIEELNSKLKEKEEELYLVKTTPATDVWKKELKELRTEYNKWYKEKHDEFLSNIEDTSKITKVKKSTDIKKKKKPKSKQQKNLKTV